MTEQYEAISQLQAKLTDVDAPSPTWSDIEILNWLDAAKGIMVVRTREHLEALTVEEPGPEVVACGCVGPNAVEAFAPPVRQFDVMEVCANLKTESGAAFVRLSLDLVRRTLAASYLDEGFFERTAYLGP